MLATFSCPVISIQHKGTVSVLLWGVFVLLTVISIQLGRIRKSHGNPFVQIKERFPGASNRPIRTEEPASEDDVRFAIREFLDRFKDGNIRQLASVITEPSKHFLRIRETGEFKDNEIVSTTIRTIHSTTRGNFLVPVLRPVKRQLIDGLNVDVDGRPISTLTYIEMMGALSLVVSLVFYSAFPDDHDDALHKRTLWKILTTIGSRTTVGEWDMEQLDEALEQLEWIHTNGEVLRVREILRDLIRLFSDNYVVIAVIQNCQVGDRLRVRVKDCRVRTESDGSLKNWLRRNVGLQLRSYRFNLPQAGETRSFHFQTECPSGTFFCHPKLIGWLNNPEHTPNVEGKISRTIQHTQIEGQQTAHLYVHDLDALTNTLPDTADLLLVLESDFRERPPGVIGVQIWISLYLAGLAWIAGYNYDEIFATGKGLATHGLDVVWSALFFSVPILVAPWITSRIIMERIRIISSATYLLLLWLVLNSVVTTFLAGIVFVSGARWSLQLDGLVSIHHTAWLILMISVGAQLSVSMLYLITKTRHYNGLLRR